MLLTRWRGTSSDSRIRGGKGWILKKINSGLCGGMQIFTHTHIQMAREGKWSKQEQRHHYTHDMRVPNCDDGFSLSQFCIKRIINMIRGKTATLSPTCDELSLPQNNKCQIKTANGWRRGMAHGMRKMYLNYAMRFFSAKNQFRLEIIIIIIIHVHQKRWTRPGGGRRHREMPSSHIPHANRVKQWKNPSNEFDKNF